MFNEIQILIESNKYSRWQYTGVKSINNAGQMLEKKRIQQGWVGEMGEESAWSLSGKMDHHRGTSESWSKKPTSSQGTLVRVSWVKQTKSLVWTRWSWFWSQEALCYSGLLSSTHLWETEVLRASTGTSFSFLFGLGFQRSLDLTSRTLGSVWAKQEKGRLCWGWPSPPFHLFPETFTLVILAEHLHIVPFLSSMEQCIHYCFSWYGQALNKSILRKEGFTVVHSLREQSIT